MDVVGEDTLSVDAIGEDIFLGYCQCGCCR